MELDNEFRSLNDGRARRQQLAAQYNFDFVPLLTTDGSVNVSAMSDEMLNNLALMLPVIASFGDLGADLPVLMHDIKEEMRRRGIG